MSTTDERVASLQAGPWASLLDALRDARNLTIPGEVNQEYVRGQAELICDMFSIPSDPGKGIITAVISHEATSAAQLIVWMCRNGWLR